MRFVALAVLPLALWAQDGAKEAALGRSMAREFRSRARVVENADARAYLHSLVARLGGGTYLVEVSADSPSSALRVASFPGGYLFVPERLIVESADEAMLAREVAHAMAHIELRHGFQPARSDSAGDGTIPVVFLGGWRGFDDAALLPQAFVAERERHEAEADALAARKMEQFVRDAAFARVRADLAMGWMQAEEKRPTLRRGGEPVR